MKQIIQSKSRNCSMDTYFLEDAKNRPVVIICPGGAYQYRSPREAEPVARAFRANGIHAVVLNYTVVGEELGDEPLLDLSWSTSYLRVHAEELGINKDQIYVCGFSAGGHLAASLGVFWNDETRFPDVTCRQEHKPNGMILCYPVISAGEYAHRGSLERVRKERKKQQEYSLEKKVIKDTPPCFIWHTMTDAAVPVQNTLLFVEALLQYEIPCEVMLFPKGPHGMSLATKETEAREFHNYADGHVARWFSQCIDWIRQQEES